MRKTNIQWSILLALAIASISVAWALAADYSPVPLFDSPVGTPTPFWEQIQITPTPRPQPIILPDIISGPATLITGLRGHWQLDETDTGDRIDSSPIGSNTLINVGGVSCSPNGKVGNASDFERSNSQYLKIESYQAVGLNFNHSFTLMGWIKRESTGSDMIMAAKYSFGSGINDRAYRFQLNSSNNPRLIVSPDGTYSSDYSVVGGTSLTSTTDWYHVTAVFDAGAQRLKLYVNGNLDADKSVSYDGVFQSSAPFMLGANLQNGSAIQHFDGLMDEWRVYNRTLSQDEIRGAMLPPAPINVKVNFQPSGSQVPAGYVPDSGETYRGHGNGYTYGWNADTFETRDRGAHSDQRYDTLNHMQKPSNPNAVWEIGLPDGTYNVYLVMGDPSYTDQVNNVDVEGVVRNDPDGQDNFDEYNLTVTIGDGKLTVQPAAGASNAKVCFIEIDHIE
jgi:hypothetical protein